ncbi:MAG TPA: hypothetical protein VJ876_07245 [Bacteroidales bacterium]|nr:hypothetical protein [Bacteroidales bacterium]
MILMALVLLSGPLVFTSKLAAGGDASSWLAIDYSSFWMGFGFIGMNLNSAVNALVMPLLRVLQ